MKNHLEKLDTHPLPDDLKPSILALMSHLTLQREEASPASKPIWTRHMDALLKLSTLAILRQTDAMPAKPSPALAQREEAQAAEITFRADDYAPSSTLLDLLRDPKRLIPTSATYDPKHKVGAAWWRENKVFIALERPAKKLNALPTGGKCTDERGKPTGFVLEGERLFWRGTLYAFLKPTPLYKNERTKGAWWDVCLAFPREQSEQDHNYA